MNPSQVAFDPTAPYSPAVATAAPAPSGQQSAASSAQFDPTAPYSPAQPDTNPSGSNGGVPVRDYGDIGEGLAQTGQDVWGVVKHIVQHPVDTAVNIATSGGVIGAGKDIYSNIKEAIPVIQAYETARSQGKGVVDSLAAANDQAAKQNQAQQILKQRVEDFKKNPTQATTRAVGDAASAAAAVWAGNEVMGAILPEASTGAADVVESAAEPEAVATAVPKPGLIKQVQRVISPKEATQAPAQQALRSGAKASAADAGVAATDTTGSIRSLLDDPIENLTKTERASYDKINKASGTDLKSLYDYAADVQDALDDPTNVTNRTALQKELQTTQNSIAKGEAQATSNGVDLDTLNQAKELTQQRYAMENVNQKLFNNESVVSGNVEHGAPEAINIDSAIRQVENLDKPSRFAPRGTPTRLQQALGEDGAKNLKQGLYDAQKAGQKVAQRNSILKWVGGAIGGIGLLGEATHLAGSLIP